MIALLPHFSKATSDLIATGFLCGGAVLAIGCFLAFLLFVGRER